MSGRASISEKESGQTVLNDRSGCVGRVLRGVLGLPTISAVSVAGRLVVAFEEAPSGAAQLSASALVEPFDPGHDT